MTKEIEKQEKVMSQKQGKRIFQSEGGVNSIECYPEVKKRPEKMVRDCSSQVVVWYSHLLKNFPHFIVIHTVKGFGIVDKAEIDVFLEVSCFFHDPADVGNLISCLYGDAKTTKIRIWLHGNIALWPSIIWRKNKG